MLRQRVVRAPDAAGAGPAHPRAARRVSASVVRHVPVDSPGARWSLHRGAPERAGARPGRHVGGHTQRHEPGDRLQSQQPDRQLHRARASCGPSWSGCPDDVVVVLDEAYGEFVTSPLREETAAWVERLSATWWFCAPSPRSTAWPVCASATASRTLRSSVPWTRCGSPSTSTRLAQVAAIGVAAAPGAGRGAARHDSGREAAADRRPGGAGHQVPSE